MSAGPVVVFGEADRIVVIDVEATCDRGGSLPKNEREIIEIGAVLVNARDYQVIDEFQSFVHPARHPQLTSFCQRLTSIGQSDVDAAPRFPEVVDAFKRWMDGHGATVYASWGNYDRRQVEVDCGYHGIPYPMPGRHVNLKTMFSAALGITKKLGMAQALREAGLELRGTHHRGIDDARSIARLLRYAVGRSSSAIRKTSSEE